MASKRYPHSQLTPRTVERMRQLNTEALKLYASGLLGRYRSRASKLTHVANRMKRDWVHNQAQFLENVAQELEGIIESGDAP